jgi:hypothetical protein
VIDGGDRDKKDEEKSIFKLSDRNLDLPPDFFTKQNQDL